MLDFADFYCYACNFPIRKVIEQEKKYFCEYSNQLLRVYQLNTYIA
jgi:hypothetical protein